MNWSFVIRHACLEPRKGGWGTGEGGGGATNLGGGNIREGSQVFLGGVLVRPPMLVQLPLGYQLLLLLRHGSQAPPAAGLVKVSHALQRL